MGMSIGAAMNHIWKKLCMDVLDLSIQACAYNYIDSTL